MLLFCYIYYLGFLSFSFGYPLLVFLCVRDAF